MLCSLISIDLLHAACASYHSLTSKRDTRKWYFYIMQDDSLQYQLKQDLNFELKYIINLSLFVLSLIFQVYKIILRMKMNDFLNILGHASLYTLRYNLTNVTIYASYSITLCYAYYNATVQYIRLLLRNGDSRKNFRILYYLPQYSEIWYPDIKGNFATFCFHNFFNYHPEKNFEFLKNRKP